MKMPKSLIYQDTNTSETTNVALFKFSLKCWVLCDEKNKLLPNSAPLWAKLMTHDNKLYDSDHENESHLSWRTAKNSKHVRSSESGHPASCTHSTLFLFKLWKQQKLQNLLYMDYRDIWIKENLLMWLATPGAISVWKSTKIIVCDIITTA